MAWHTRSQCFDHVFSVFALAVHVLFTCDKYEDGHHCFIVTRLQIHLRARVTKQNPKVWICRFSGYCIICIARPRDLEPKMLQEPVLVVAVVLILETL